MLSLILSLALYLSLLALAMFVVFVGHLMLRYVPIIMRIFEEKPMFLPLRVAPRSDGEAVHFPTADGFELAGTYLPARTKHRSGVLVFCHEFLSDRWSYEPYADALRDLGFDLFTFDFRNHGASASDPAYKPLQWVSDHEVHDLQAALRFLRTRADRDAAGFGLFGISKGGGTAMVVAAGEPDVWGVITDGAFATRGMMLNYILRWAQIFVVNRVVYAILRDYAPVRFFKLLIAIALHRAGRKLSCRFSDVEKGVARLAPRPLLMIHGGKDAYIGTEVARQLFDRADQPKELWIVPGAKHNRCREVDAETYDRRIRSFLHCYAPRPLIQLAASAEGDSAVSPPLVPASDAAKVAVPRSPHVERIPAIERVTASEPAPSHSPGLAISVSG